MLLLLGQFLHIFIVIGATVLVWYAFKWLKRALTSILPLARHNIVEGPAARVVQSIRGCLAGSVPQPETSR